MLLKFLPIILLPLAFTATADSSLSKVITALEPSQSQVAIIVEDNSTGKVIISKNADRFFIPASTQKLLTAVAATSILGSNYQFKTSITSAKRITNGVIDGDVYINFSGDPSLTRQNIKKLVAELASLGVKRISGNVYLAGKKHNKPHAVGWVWDDLGVCYAAPVSSFIIDKNCIKAKLIKAKNNQLSVKYARYLPISINSNAQINKNSAFCDLDLAHQVNNHYQLSGCYNGYLPLNLRIAIDDPIQYAIATLSKYFKHQHIQVSGQFVESQKEAKSQRILVVHHSQNLSVLINEMLLDSDNLIADSLLKQIGQRYFGQQGSFENGAKAMTEILAQYDINLTDAQIVDGSGLSRYNLLTATQLMQILRLIDNNPKFKGLVADLPVAGLSGTLKYRSYFNKVPLKQNVYAKTGTMQGVANLAGYVTNKEGHKYRFVIIENGLTPNNKKAQIAPFAAITLQAIIEQTSK